MTVGDGLRVDGVTAGYGKSTVLHDVSLHVGPGEVVALLGANGAGKSTFVKTVAGSLACRSGSITLDGDEVTRLRAEHRARRGVILVPEGRRLFQAMTVAENIEAGSCAASDAAAGRDAVERLLDLFPVLRERWHQQAGLLSGGQQQMLALTRAVAGTPRFLLLDEPSLGLSPILCEEVFLFIEAIANETGAGVVLVEQMATRALALAGRAYVLDRGVIVHEGTAAEIAASDAVAETYLT